MPLYPHLLQMLNAEANIADTRAQTGERLAMLVLNAQRAKALQQREALDEAYRTEFERQQTVGDPGTNNAATLSLGASEAQDASPYRKTYMDLQQHRRMALDNINLAQRYGQDPKPWVTALNSADTQLREITQDMSKEVKEKAQQTAQVLRDVDSPEALTAALEQVEAFSGAKARKKIDAQLPHDDAGAVVWNERAKQVIAPYVSQYTTMHEKAQQEHNRATLARQSASDAERARDNQEQNRLRAAEIAVRREGISAANVRHAKTLEAMGGKEQYRVTKDDQATLGKLATNYKIIDYQKGNEVATRVATALLDPTKGYESITAPNARTLVDQGRLMRDNYRARTGGKYQEAQDRAMNSLLARAEKYAETIGEGDKLLAKDVMLQLSREMQTMYADRNADLLRDELNLAAKTNKKGGNASWLALKGDVAAAVETGKAKKVTHNGKDYLAFGKRPEDIYELPAEPGGRLAPPVEETTE